MLCHHFLHSLWKLKRLHEYVIRCIKLTNIYFSVLCLHTFLLWLVFHSNLHLSLIYTIYAWNRAGRKHFKAADMSTSHYVAPISTYYNLLATISISSCLPVRNFSPAENGKRVDRDGDTTTESTHMLPLQTVKSVKVAKVLASCSGVVTLTHMVTKTSFQQAYFSMCTTAAIVHKQTGEKSRKFFILNYKSLWHCFKHWAFDSCVVVKWVVYYS